MITVQVLETSSFPSPEAMTTLCSVARTGSRSCSPRTGRPARPCGIRQEASRRLPPAAARPWHLPGRSPAAAVEDRGDQLMAGNIRSKQATRPAKGPGGVARAVSAGSLPGTTAAQDRAGHRAACAGGDRGSPHRGTGRSRPPFRSSRTSPRSPGCPLGSPASCPPRRPASGQHDRRRLVIADERPGCPPRDVFHHICRDRQPPVRDHFPRRDVPGQGERDVREQPGQPGQRLAVRPARARVIAIISRMTSG